MSIDELAKAIYDSVTDPDTGLWNEAEKIATGRGYGRGGETERELKALEKETLRVFTRAFRLAAVIAER